MRYFLTRVDKTTLLYETDDDLTESRIIRKRKNNKKISDPQDSDSTFDGDKPSVCVPITNKEYFLDITIEVPEEEVFSALL
jgi:hypothetical protein